MEVINISDHNKSKVEKEILGITEKDKNAKRYLNKTQNLLGVKFVDNWGKVAGYISFHDKNDKVDIVGMDENYLLTYVKRVSKRQYANIKENLREISF